MNYEVELKFAVSESDIERLRGGLTARGIAWREPVEQVDRYWGHPARDFAETDEALRIRREGSEAWLTYKGPKIDPASKTRQEIELRLAGANGGEQMSALLQALGFVDFAVVRKRRTPGEVSYLGRAVHVALDSVADLGTFVELETVADQGDLQTAQAAIGALAAELGLAHGIRRSYLEMLLDKPQ